MPVNVVGPDALIGEVIDGRYTVLELIATGGMASVYRAVDTRLDRDVALKVMRPHLAHDERFVSRFKREALAAARLSHPNIVSIYDQGNDAGRVWLAMEYVPGRTLRQIVEDDGALTPRAALDILEPMLLALAEAHRGGIIHRDIKPENVIIRDDGVVKVADFGLARAVNTDTATSATSEVLGTLAYISPEQVDGGGQVTTRSDVYAAGLLLFEMLTGRKAFAGESIPKVLFQHLHSGVPAPSSVLPGIPLSLDSLVLSASAKDPQERPEDAAEFLAEVRHVRRLMPESELDGVATTAADSPAASAAGSGTTAYPGRPDTDTAAPTTSQPAEATSVLPVAPAGAGATSADTQPFNLAQPAAQPLKPAPRVVKPAPKPLPTNPTGNRPQPPHGTHDGHDAAGAAPRRRRRGILAALVALLLAAGGAGWYFTAGPGSPTTVPTLTGLTAQQAVAALTTAHLDAKQTEAFSETVAKGIVISATPGEGASLRRGADVTLTISKGKERYAVPDLMNVSRKTATERLAKVNLSPGKVTTAYSDTIPKGRVVSFEPAAGTQLKRGEPVNFVLSDGPQPFDVPDFLGKTQEEAQALAEQAGLTIEMASEPIFSTDYDKDTVAAQTPADGQVVRGDTVTLTLSKGPELVEVPSCFNKSEAESVALLKAAGFEVDVKKFLGGPLDTCTGQTPAGGTKAPKGTTVTITIV